MREIKEPLTLFAFRCLGVGMCVGFLYYLLLFATGCSHGSKRKPPEMSSITMTGKGLDILGLAKQDVGMIANALEPGMSIGVLEGTFGAVLGPLEALLNTKKVPAFRVHLINGTCWRNKNCEAGEPQPNDIEVLKARARGFSELAKRTKTKCYLSPVLEHDEKSQALVNAWFEALKVAAPNCTAVQNPHTGVGHNGAIIERHGRGAAAHITSTDGISGFDSDSRHYQQSGNVFSFNWINRFNLRVTGEKVFVPPSKRTFKASQIDIIQAQRLLRPMHPKPPKPAQCGNARELTGAELWKTNAEDYASADPRGNKPLLIHKTKAKNLDILAPSGQKIGCLKWYGSYNNGPYQRLYAGSCSGDSGVSLMDKAGSEWVFVKDGGSCYMVNAIRRGPYFQ